MTIEKQMKRNDRQTVFNISEYLKLKERIMKKRIRNRVDYLKRKAVGVAALFMGCLSLQAATNTIGLVITSPTAPDYSIPSGWRVEELGLGNAWNFVGNASVTNTGPTNVVGFLRLTNVASGWHTYRALSFAVGVSGFGPPSSTASTNVVVLPPTFIFSVEVQTVSISSGGSSNLATWNFRAPPIPGVQDVQLVRSKVSVTKQ